MTGYTYNQYTLSLSKGVKSANIPHEISRHTQGKKKNNLQDKTNMNSLWQSRFAAYERTESEENEGGEP